MLSPIGAVVPLYVERSPEVAKGAAAGSAIAHAAISKFSSCTGSRENVP
ncbi:hypothetical protein NDI52_32290 [Leptolyngbya sp. PL-A3]